LDWSGLAAARACLLLTVGNANRRKAALNLQSAIRNSQSDLLMYLPVEQYIPQTTRSSARLIAWAVVALTCFFVLSLVVSAPLAVASGHSLVGTSIYQAFSHVCHQLPERSFLIAGHPLAVCSRCTGLYAGFALTVLLYPLISLRRTETPERKWLFVAATPLAFDVVLDFLGLWTNTHGSRFATGVVLGAAAVFYVMPGLVTLSLRYCVSQLRSE